MTSKTLVLSTVNVLILMALLSGCATVTQTPALGDPIQLSREAFRAGDLGAADKILSHAISQTPDRADLWNARGFVRMHRNEPHQAGLDFTKAIRLDPDNVRYRSNLAVILLETGNSAEALVELDRVMAMAGPSFLTLNHRGLAKSRLGEYRSAVADFTGALEYENGNAEAYANRGVAYAKLGARAQARADFEQALAIDTKLRQVYESRGLIELVEGEFQEAIADFSRAIELGATDGLVFYNRAVAFSITGEKKSAEQDYQAACRLGVPQGCLGIIDMTASLSDSLWSTRDRDILERAAPPPL